MRARRLASALWTLSVGDQARTGAREGGRRNEVKIVVRTACIAATRPGAGASRESLAAETGARKGVSFWDTLRRAARVYSVPFCWCDIYLVPKSFVGATYVWSGILFSPSCVYSSAKTRYSRYEIQPAARRLAVQVGAVLGERFVAANFLAPRCQNFDTLPKAVY